MSKKYLLPNIDNCMISIIGMGYVGLPLALEFSKLKFINSEKINHKVIGFDINKKRISELKNCYDRTNETDEKELKQADNLFLTNNEDDLLDSDVYIITVPTPVDKANIPDLTAINEASRIVGASLSKRKKSPENFSKNSKPLIVYESTVYPGATRDNCIPIVEKFSGLSSNVDFFFGYSPERINPGDKTKRLTSIKKVTSGSTPLVSEWINKLYSQIITEGTHMTKSIEVAEAAKIIENVQRDINIALINELSMIFSKLNIDTFDVLEASKTKWNFLPFEPGLVGGHCIGIDPYYLTYKAKLAGLYPEIVSSGRRINERMPDWIAERIIINITKKDLILNQSNILCLGLTFKRNCPDIRNSKVINLLNKLLEFNMEVDVLDPYIKINEVKNYFQFNTLNKLINKKKYTCVILAVDHDEFREFDVDLWKSLLDKNGFIFDLKNTVPRVLNPVRI